MSENLPGSIRHKDYEIKPTPMKVIVENNEKWNTQFEILEQFRIQLKRYADYALKVGQPEIAEKYTAVLAQVRRIYDEKVKDNDLMDIINKEQPDQALGLMSSQMEESLGRILRS